ncbi:MAG: prepilin-type N-terminal cleavage/methylation domain-containing protein [Xanthomonadales bacterium]|nr:prepilin-type N-terminal cleavage/methylation domain-containing protein [Xanthomonadales bacterium]
MPRRPPMIRPSQGFSLIEVLVVVSLIALLVGMVGTSVYRSLDGVKVRQAGKDLVTALRYTRGQAIVAREERTLNVDVEKKTFRAPEQKAVELPDGVDVTIRTAAFDLDRSVGKVRFFPDGSSTGAQITLTAGERSWLISVGWLTGEIALETGADS